MNMSNSFFSKLQLVKPLGRLRGTHYRREALYNWLVELRITCGMKSIASLKVKTCTIYTVNTPSTRPSGPPDKTHSDQRDISWRRLVDRIYCHANSTGQLQESIGTSGHFFFFSPMYFGTAVFSFVYLFIYLFFNFTILYWFCHTPK